MPQLTILKITGYGPWTLTLGSDREHELQMLQASIYKEIQKIFSEKKCLVFPNRSDEFFIVSDGLDLDDHIEAQKILKKSFDLRLSISIGYAKSPFDANLKAHEGRQSSVMLDADYDICGFVGKNSDAQVTIMHLDVEDLTSETKTRSPYEISLAIFGLYHKMSDFFLAKKYLTFFMGGDNFMVISDENAKSSAKEFLDIAKKDNIILNCGIGTSRTAREAAELATKSLDTIRKIRDSGKEKPEIYELSCF